MVTEKEQNKLAFAWVGLIAVIGILASYLDVKQDKEDRAYYCEMVALWHQDAANGVQAEQRNGWPNYRKLECTSGS